MEYRVSNQSIPVSTCRIFKKKFWDIADKLERPHGLFGYGQYEPSEEFGDADYSGEMPGYIDLILRLHKLNFGDIQASLELHSIQTSSGEILTGEDGFGNPEDSEGWLELVKLEGGITYRHAISIGFGLLAGNSSFQEEPQKIGGRSIENIWGLEFSILRVSNLFPGLENVQLKIGESNVDIVDFEQASVKTLFALGNDTGITSNVVYTGLPLFTSFRLDTFKDPTASFFSPRFSSGAYLFPVSFTPTWELERSVLTSYDVNLDWLRLLVLSPFLISAGETRALFLGDDMLYKNMEKGVSNVDMAGEEGFILANTVVGYSRNYYGLYSELDQPYDSEKIYATIDMAMVVGKYVLFIIGGEIAEVHNMETGSRNLSTRFSISLGYQSGFLNFIATGEE